MITFYRAVEAGLAPCPADPSANGTLPTNGFRFCEPVRTASGFGWYVFLPMELWILWDGTEHQWSLDKGESWYVLADAIQYPRFAAAFDAAGPEPVQGYSPPFLSRTNDLDIVQIWSGLFARTEDGIASWVRGPVNLIQTRDIEVLEGVVGTDWWFGPLFANVRILKRGSPVVFRADRPFLQILPYDARLSTGAMEVKDGLGALAPDDWQAYRDTIVRRMETRTRLGQYAVEARQRAKAADV